MSKTTKANRLFMVLVAGIFATMLFTACNDDKKSDTTSTTKTVARTTTTSTTYNMDASDIQKILKAGVLNVGCKADVPKFGSQNTTTGEFEGMEIDIAYYVAAKIFGVSPEQAKGLVNFTAVTAATRGELLNNGTIDMVAATFTIKPARLENWNFSTPYFTDHIGLMVKKSEGYKSAADLDKSIIGIADGATTGDAITAYLKENNIDVKVTFHSFATYPDISAALSSGNVDVFSVDRSILAGYNDDSTEILPDSFGPQDYGIATRLSDTDFTNLVNATVVEMLDDGSIETLLSQYGIE